MKDFAYPFGCESTSTLTSLCACGSRREPDEGLFHVCCSDVLTVCFVKHPGKEVGLGCPTAFLFPMLINFVSSCCSWLHGYACMARHRAWAPTRPHIAPNLVPEATQLQPDHGHVVIMTAFLGTSCLHSCPTSSLFGQIISRLWSCGEARRGMTFTTMTAFFWDQFRAQSFRGGSRLVVSTRSAKHQDGQRVPLYQCDIECLSTGCECPVMFLWQTMAGRSRFAPCF